MITPYADITFADSYFENFLNAEEYTAEDNTTKGKALNHATLLIDNVGFMGSKSVSTQDRQFPRDVTRNLIPVAIQEACCEVALQLLQGFDVNDEHIDVNIISEGYANVRTTRDTDKVPEYISYGIPCLTAWLKIKPYLRNNRTVKLIKS